MSLIVARAMVKLMSVDGGDRSWEWSLIIDHGVEVLITDYRLPITDYRLPITHYPLPTFTNDLGLRSQQLSIITVLKVEQNKPKRDHSRISNF